METNELVAGKIDTRLYQMEDIANEILNQIRTLQAKRKTATYVILDRTTMALICSAKNRSNYMWFGYEQVDSTSPDRICGVPIAVITGCGIEQVIEVKA